MLQIAAAPLAQTADPAARDLRRAVDVKTSDGLADAADVAPSVDRQTMGAGAPVLLTEATLGAAFDMFSQDVFRYCLRAVSGDRTAAEDLMSVVFFEAWRSRKNAILVDGQLSAWLFGIAANVVSTSRRSRRRYAATLHSFHASNPALIEPDHADAAATTVDAPADRQRLDAAFGQLSTRDRDVVTACLVDGLTAKAAASLLDLPESAVKSRLGRARAHLRRLLHSSESGAAPSLGRSCGHVRDERHHDAWAGGITTDRGAA